MHNQINSIRMNFICKSIPSPDTMGGYVGLAITQVFNLIYMCQWGMRQTAELENQMTSVERVLEYTNLPSEAALKTPNKLRPLRGWPRNGDIVFENFNLQYDSDGDKILKDLNLTIQASVRTLQGHYDALD